jgi:hypothetical protein
MKKRYSINNSYFKKAYSENLPVTLTKIHEYVQTNKQLPFEGVETHENWAYRAMIEKQKRTGVYFSQFLTPDLTAERIAKLCKDFFLCCDTESTSESVLDACIGTAQLAKGLLDTFDVVGFDVCPDMHAYCNAIGIPTEKCSFEDYTQTHQYIVSNPPYEKLADFFAFLDRSLVKKGVAVLLLPSHTWEMKKPKLIDLRAKFSVIYAENMQENFAHTSIKASIFVVSKK